MTQSVQPSSQSAEGAAPAGADSDEMVFHRAARSGQIPEGYVRRFFVGDVECAISRLRGKAYASSNYCTHLDCLLSSGKMVDEGIGCSCHGSVFDPETGAPLCPPATEPIAVFPVKEEDGQIYVGIKPSDIDATGPRRRLRRFG